MKIRILGILILSSLIAACSHSGTGGGNPEPEKPMDREKARLDHLKRAIASISASLDRVDECVTKQSVDHCQNQIRALDDLAEGVLK